MCHWLELYNFISNNATKKHYDVRKDVNAELAYWIALEDKGLTNKVATDWHIYFKSNRIITVYKCTLFFLSNI